METILSCALAAWMSPLGAAITLVILSLFGFWLYKWVRHEPKIPGAEHQPGGTSRSGITR